LTPILTVGTLGYTMACMQLREKRHELFLREYLINGWNGKEAYIKVYGPVKTAHIQAHKLLKKPHVRQRFNQMVNKLIKRADITEERILSQYQDAYDMARDQGKSADMISASTAQAKLVGLLKDRIEHGAPGEFEHLENVSDVLEALSQQIGPEAALSIGKALGITQAVVAPPVVEADDATLAAIEAPSNSVN
jgi:hypothetical protein